MYSVHSLFLTSLFLFVWGLTSHSRIFHSYRDVTITDEGLRILTYARHSWPLSSLGLFGVPTYCDTEHPLIMVISEDPMTPTYCRAFDSRNVTTCFYDVCLSRLGFEHPTFRIRGKRSNRLNHRGGY